MPRGTTTAPQGGGDAALDAREPSEARRVRAKVSVRLAPGRPIAGTRFELVRWLGDGGMGVVYEARHLDLGKRVALKIMRPEVCMDPDVLERFRQEARTASQLGSEYIVEVFDFAELSDGRLLFAMELVEGTPLVDELRGGPMDPARLLGILRQLCKGLAAAHAQGIVHRDIKPENVMLRPRRGRADAITILDFGISAMMADKDGHASVTEVMGTPYYLAPEIIDRGRFDGRADIYSVGCTAYEMLVGRPPFLSDDVVEVLRAHMMREPESISSARPESEVPPALEAVIMRCLAKDPDQRFRDMADLEAALCEAQIEADLRTPWDDLPIPEVEPERREHLLREMPDPITDVVRLGDPSARRRGFPALLIGTVLALGVAIGTALATPSEETAREDPQATQLERLTEAAWGAAGKSLYAYPSSDAPDQPTAYSIVREIEAMRGPIAPLAHDRAAALREEMATTLVRLGDDFWDKEGGLGFAIDYYAQAVLFDPTHERANERASITPGQLALLRHKAELQEFTPGELVAVEPLVVLAADAKKADGPDKRLAKIRKQAVADAEGLATAAAQAAKRGNAGEARRGFEGALAKDRRNLVALVGLSEILVAHKDYAKAASLLERAVALEPRQATHRTRLADAYYRTRRYRDALDQYERAVELGDASAGYWVERTREKIPATPAAEAESAKP